MHRKNLRVIISGTKKRKHSSHVEKKNMRLFLEELTVHQFEKQYMKCVIESAEPASTQPQQMRETT